MNKGGYVYLMTNAHNTVIYTGVTADLFRRVYEHKTNNKGFTGRYQCHKLVYWEAGSMIEGCIAREKQVKSGSRAKKIALIESMNPHWLDLSADWYS